MIDEKLLEILACPACHAPVELLESESRLQCTNQDCRMRYVIRDGIPDMRLDYAEKPADASGE